MSRNTQFSSGGMKIGINSARFVGRDIPGKGITSMPGFAIGGFFSYRFNERYSIQPEFLFTTKGAKINTIGEVYLTNLFAYIEFPLLVKMTFLPENRIKPNIFCGPALAFSYFALNDTGFLEDIRGTDFGLILGAGFEFWKISFDTRFNRDLLTFDESEDNLDLKNSCISFTVGYSF
jgi:hypothetical protein